MGYVFELLWLYVGMGIVVVKRKTEFFTTNGKKKNQNKIQDGELQEERKKRDANL